MVRSRARCRRPCFILPKEPLLWKQADFETKSRGQATTVSFAFLLS